jgi:hypothetical protein
MQILQRFRKLIQTPSKLIGHAPTTPSYPSTEAAVLRQRHVSAAGAGVVAYCRDRRVAAAADPDGAVVLLIGYTSREFGLSEGMMVWEARFEAVESWRRCGKDVDRGRIRVSF